MAWRKRSANAPVVTRRHLSVLAGPHCRATSSRWRADAAGLAEVLSSRRTAAWSSGRTQGYDQGEVVESARVGSIDCIGESGHRGERPVRRDGRRRFWGRTPARLRMTAIDPYRRQTGCLGRHVVVEQALRDVQQLALADAQASRLRSERLEVARRRLVRADVLGGHDAHEGHAEPVSYTHLTL